MHKTGTSSIQNNLHNYTGKKYFYPKLNSPNQSIAITAAFDHQNKTYAGFKHMKKAEIEALSQSTMASLEAACQQSANIVLSGEDISLMTIDGAKNILSYFRQKVDHIQMVYYLRDPDSFASSAFQEYIKQGMDSIPSQIDPRYRFRIEKFIDSNMIDKLIIKEFNPSLLRHGCVVRDFFEELGIEYSPNSILSSNESLSTLACKILWRFNSYLKIKPEDLTCKQARRSFNNIIKNLFKSTEPINKKMFRFLASTDDLEFLAEKCEFRFSSAETITTQTRDNNSAESLKSLAEYLDAISFNELTPLLKWLNKRDATSSPKDVNSLILRAFIECVKINATKHAK